MPRTKKKGPGRPSKEELAARSRLTPKIEFGLDNVTIVCGQRSLKMSRREYADLQLVMGAMS